MIVKSQVTDAATGGEAAGSSVTEPTVTDDGGNGISVTVLAEPEDPWAPLDPHNPGKTAPKPWRRGDTTADDSAK